MMSAFTGYRITDWRIAISFREVSIIAKDSLQRCSGHLPHPRPDRASPPPIPAAMDTVQARTEALQAVLANPQMALAVTQLMGRNQVRINTFKWRDVKGSTSMIKLSDEVSVRGQDLENAIPALIAAEVSKPNSNKHSNSQPWALEYTEPGDEG
jgi:hypothetical protein